MPGRIIKEYFVNKVIEAPLKIHYVVCRVGRKWTRDDGTRISHEYLERMDAQNAGLVHLPSALVGTPYTCLQVSSLILHGSLTYVILFDLR